MNGNAKLAIFKIPSKKNFEDCQKRNQPTPVTNRHPEKTLLLHGLEAKDTAGVVHALVVVHIMFEWHLQSIIHQEFT